MITIATVTLRSLRGYDYRVLSHPKRQMLVPQGPAAEREFDLRGDKRVGRKSRAIFVGAQLWRFARTNEMGAAIIERHTFLPRRFLIVHAEHQQPTRPEPAVQVSQPRVPTIEHCFR